MQPAQDRRALFFGRPAKTDECALGCGDGATRVILVAQVTWPIILPSVGLTMSMILRPWDSTNAPLI
jgi:hypothetical protein